MQRIKLFLLTAVTILLGSLIATKVFAGGGLISFEVDPDYTLNPGGQYIVRPTVYRDNNYKEFCDQCPIKIYLENPQPDDYVVQSSVETDEKGTMYVKVISRIPGNRVLYAVVTMPDGTPYRSSVVILNYKTSSSIPVGPTTIPLPEITPEVLELTPTPSLVAQEVGMVTPEFTPDTRVDELNQKVANLQSELEQTKQKQASLETTLNQLITWIKSIFPFFGR